MKLTYKKAVIALLVASLITLASAISVKLDQNRLDKTVTLALDQIELMGYQEYIADQRRGAPHVTMQVYPLPPADFWAWLSRLGGKNPDMPPPPTAKK